MTSDPIIENDPKEVVRLYTWVKNHDDYSESTARKYRQGARRWVKWCRSTPTEQHSFDVDPLDPERFDVEQFFSSEIMTELSAKTRSTTRAGLNVFLRFNVDEWANPNPGPSGSYPDQTPADKAQIGSWSAESIKSESERSDVYWLDEDQVDDLVSHVPEPKIRNKLIIRLMLQTGVRASEIATIRCGRNPDWDSNSLRDIDQEKRTIEVEDRKSDGYRTVVYQQSLDPLLRLYIESERPGIYGADESPYLFVTTHGEHINSQVVNTKIVKKAADRANINRPYMTTSNGQERSTVTSHTLRHTFAMHSLKNGLDTKWIKEQLGHEDIGTTIDLYLHEDKETMRREIRNHGADF